MKISGQVYTYRSLAVITAASVVPFVAFAASQSAPAIPAGKTVRATIDAGKTHQTIEGFGAATAYYQNWIAEHPNKKALYDTFFKGLNLSILRLQNVYRPTKGADFAKNDADIVRGAQASLGKPIRILMSSWSPPADLKSTGQEKGGGTLARENGAYVYDKFAGYWADSLGAYKKIGVTPTWVSIQNEPDWKADWETCLFQPSETKDDKGAEFAGYDRALDAVYRRFRTIPGGAPKLLGPETLGIGGQKVQNYLGAKDSAPARQVAGVAYHLYYGGDHQAPDTFIPTLRGVRDAYPNKTRWMTEFGRSDGFQTAWVIHNTLAEGDAAAYVYWAGIWPGKDTLINIDNPANPKATWKLPNGFQPTDRYYGLKHYSNFVSPGYKRVTAGTSDPAIKMSAYLSPDKSRLVAVALNTSTTVAAKLSLTMRGFTGTSSAIYRSVLPPPPVTPTEGEKVGVSGPGERFRSLGRLPKGNTVTLPPHSIVTIVLRKGK
ncbi:MAG: glycoside hydrolase family 30 beta sandwich domain-containing protein [Armatimonadota bacterium]